MFKILISIIFLAAGIGLGAYAMLKIDPAMPGVNFLSANTKHAVDYYIYPSAISVKVDTVNQVVSLLDNQNHSFAITGQTYYDYLTNVVKNWPRIDNATATYTALPPTDCQTVLIRFKADANDNNLDTLGCVNQAIEFSIVN